MAYTKSKFYNDLPQHIIDQIKVISFETYGRTAFGYTDRLRCEGWNLTGELAWRIVEEKNFRRLGDGYWGPKEGDEA